MSAMKQVKQIGLLVFFSAILSAGPAGPVGMSLPEGKADLRRASSPQEKSEVVGLQSSQGLDQRGAGRLGLLESVTQLSVDDGTFEDAVRLVNRGTESCVNRLTPPSYPATLSQVVIYFKSGEGMRVGDQITILVGANEDGDEDIDGTIFQTESARVLALDEFNTYEVPDFTIDSGDFVVGFRMSHNRRVFPCSEDQTPPARRRSYGSTDDVTFQLVDGQEFAGNFGIRAEVTVPRDELSVDDGTFEDTIGRGDGRPEICVNRLTPPGYPVTLRKVAIYFHRNSGLEAGNPLTVLVGTDPDGDGNIDGTAFLRYERSVTSLDEFNIYEVPATTISSGDFIVGFSIIGGTGVFPCAVDLTPPSRGRSHAGVDDGDGMKLQIIDELGSEVAGNFGIRAQVGVEPDIEVLPTSLDFGEVVVGTSADRTLIVRNKGSRELMVSGIASSDEPFSIVSPAGSFSVAAGGQQVVTVQFAPLEAGAQSGDLSISSDDPDGATVVVPVSGEGVPAVPDIDVTPASLNFGSVIVGQSRDLTLTVKNVGTAALMVSSISRSDGQFTIVSPAGPFSVTAGGQQLVTVRFTPGGLGSQSGTLSITSDDPDEGVVLVPVSGEGVPAVPDINVMPASLNFGSVVVGQSRDLTLMVMNVGTATLNVSSISSNDAQFSIVSPVGPFAVMPGGQQLVTVRFTPAGTGPQSGSLSIPSDDPDEAIVPVPLSGDGAEPGMGIVFDSSSSGGGEGSVSFDHTIGSGPNRILLVGVSIRLITEADGISVDYGGIPLTKICEQTRTGKKVHVELWYLLDPPVGSASVAVSFSGGSRVVAGAASFFGVDQTNPLDECATSEADTRNASVDVPSSPGGFAFDTISTTQFAFPLSAGGQTELWAIRTEFGGRDSTGGGGMNEGGGSMSWTIAQAKEWAMAGVAVRPAN